VRDLAAVYSHVLRQERLVPIDVLGFSLGGWIAAEMLGANPAQFGKAALVAPFGIKPSEGFIMDFFPMAAADYVKHSVADVEAVEGFATLYGPASPEQYENWEDARTECARLAWEPYMHNQSLEGLLRGVSDVPVLLFWGEKDAILPESAVQAYLSSVSGSRVHIFKDCGHRPEVERPQEFLSALNRFFA
jgi:pimeloyl-ACP methyl ester carboxylesterase